MTYEEARQIALDRANSEYSCGAPIFFNGEFAAGIENKETFAFIERVPNPKPGCGPFISPRVYVVDKGSGEVTLHYYFESDINKYVRGMKNENHLKESGKEEQ